MTAPGWNVSLVLYATKNLNVVGEAKTAIAEKKKKKNRTFEILHVFLNSICLAIEFSSQKARGKL